MANENTTNLTDSGKHEYEAIYILQPKLEEDGLKALNDHFTQIVVGQKGEITTTEPWGKRNLAYTINKFGEGYYMLHRFNMDPKGATEVDRFLRLNEDVLRYLVIRTDE